MSCHQRGRSLVTDYIMIASVFACLLVCACQARTLHAQSSSSCSKKLFWFTAITTKSDLEYWRYAKVALLSSKEHSPNLVPVIIVGGAQGSASIEFLENLAWFRDHGGIVYHHNLTFGADLQNVVDQGLRDQKWYEAVEGTYMRLDIPLIMPHLLKQLEERKQGLSEHINQELALYTDADVMFYHEVNPCNLEKPEVMAIGPEMDRKAASWSDLNKNSGVLLINLKGLATVLPSMVKFANSKNWDFAVMDQSLINEFFPDHDPKHRDLSPLPEPYNWKGYWGCSPNIIITHWHGPKPERCLNCYIDHMEKSKVDKNAYINGCKCNDGYNELWRRAVEADGGGLYLKLISDQNKYAIAAGDAAKIGAY